MARENLEDKICVKCGEKTPHEVTGMGIALQGVVVVVVFGIITALTGIGGALPALIVSIPIYWGLGKMKKYVCHLCGCRYSTERANKFIRKRNRAKRKERWEEQNRSS